MLGNYSPPRADQISVGYKLNNTVTSGITQQCHMMHRNRIAKIQNGQQETFIPRRHLTPQRVQRVSHDSFHEIARRADEIRTNRHLINRMVDINFNPSKSFLQKLKTFRCLQVQRQEHKDTSPKALCFQYRQAQVRQSHYAREFEVAPTTAKCKAIIPSETVD